MFIFNSNYLPDIFESMNIYFMKLQTIKIAPFFFFFYYVTYHFQCHEFGKNRK